MPLARALLLIGLVFLAGCGRDEPGVNLKRILERGELVVGLEAEFFPFEYVKEGKLTGFDVDLARELAKDLGVKLRIVDLSWTSLPAELQTGKIDMILSGMTITEDRAKRMAFTEPYFVTGLCLLLHTETTKDVKSYEDLNSERYRVVAKTGTTGHFAAEKMLPKAKLYTLPKEGSCALEVSQGKADAFVYDQLSVVKSRNRYTETTRAILEPFTHEPYGMAIRLGEPDWLGRLNRFIADVKKDGRYDEIYQRHLGELLGDAK